LVATGQTGLYSKIGIAAMVCSLPLAYLLMAPSSLIIPGMNMGASGLALKMVIVQFLATNVQLFYNCRYLGISYYKWMLYQVIMIPVVYVLAYGASFVSHNLLNEIIILKFNIMATNITTFALAGLLFLVVLLGVVYLFPRISGISRVEIFEMMQRIK